MPVVDTASLKSIERLPGWRGRYFHSDGMTFAHYDFVQDASIHEPCHREEEVYEVIEGELVAQVARPGLAAIVPANARHSVKAPPAARRSSSTIRRGAISGGGSLELPGPLFSIRPRWIRLPANQVAFRQAEPPAPH